MKYLKINLENLEIEQINEIADYLKRGKIIVYPTDTIYGLGCLASNSRAVNKLLKIKKRSEKNGLIILIKSYCMLHDYCYITPKQEKYIRSIWPPTTREAHDPEFRYNKPPATFILKGRAGLAKDVYGKGNSLAVRLPKNNFLIKILSVVNQPIISTSLNLTGGKPLKSVSQIDRIFKNLKPDLVIDAGIIKVVKPSQLIDVRDMNNIKILRK